MVDETTELWTTQQAVEHLEVTINNLRQLQFRKALNWVKKEGKSVFYDANDVRALKIKRESRKAVN
jgi:hypothetical protein